MPQLHDIPLPLPASEILLKSMLVIFFLIHIVFVELMVGASILTTFFEWLGFKKKNKYFDVVAYEIARTITVNKSMAVVMGVGPLLLINVTYTIFFYSSSVFIGNAWILIVPLAIVAFLLTYLHQYAWDWFENKKRLHILTSVGATLIFLFIPFLFLTNTNLMWFPSIWDRIHGFLSALIFPNIFARYFFFLGATFSATGIFLIWRFSKSKELRNHVSFNSGEHAVVLTIITKTIIVGMIIQGFAGLVVFITADKLGVNHNIYPYLIFTVITFLIGFGVILKDYLRINYLNVEQLRVVIPVLFLSILSAGILRHQFRENALRPHVQNMRKNTQDYQEKVQQALHKYGSQDYSYEQ